MFSTSLLVGAGAREQTTASKQQHTMSGSSGAGGLVLEIPPAKSPLLFPTDYHRGRSGSVDSYDDLEFLAPSSGNWEENNQYDDNDFDVSDDESIEDFSLEDGHVEGIPSAGMRLEAKQYQAPEFAASLLELLRDDLQVPGWVNLPNDLPASLLHIHKVSGSLTNAVFFVSVPPETFDVSTAGSATPVIGRPPPIAEGTSTTPPSSGRVPPSALTTIHVEAPTILLRIYGPSSGSLISRKTELHILHTLSNDYNIGPAILGTFSNGRVEEYFLSRALHKDEMRMPQISRCIGRRMRELHRVDLERVELPGGPEEKPVRPSARPSRPGMSGESGGRNHSTGSGGGGSVYSTSSSSSIFSFGTSAYSTSSSGSTTSSGTTTSARFSGGSLVDSPQFLPRRGSSESRAESKKRGRPSAPIRTRRAKDKLGVWENITRWTREAKLVLKELDQLVQMPGFAAHLGRPLSEQEAKSLSSHDGKDHVVPLSSPALTLSLREELNLPLFEQQVKLYRMFVREWEKQEGKSKRVFAHNDTQYGNLLLENHDLEVDKDKIVIHCIDFEYSSANPRGFDIANHFIEWQADYHHPALSHSLFVHGAYPTPLERARFLRAYVGCDGGIDSSSTKGEPATAAEEDPRVLRLQDEVRIWEPSSHAMWAVWGIVQAKEDLMAKVEKWKQICERKRKSSAKLNELAEEMEKTSVSSSSSRPVLIRGKSGEVVNGEDEDTDVGEEEEEAAADFDYLSYSLGRMRLFREELRSLGFIQ